MRVTSKGQITLPASFRKSHDIHPGDQVVFNSKTGKVMKMPTKKEWAKVLQNIPNEDTHMDENGNYDRKQAPHFHSWMKNG